MSELRHTRHEQGHDSPSPEHTRILGTDPLFQVLGLLTRGGFWCTFIGTMVLYAILMLCAGWIISTNYTVPPLEVITLQDPRELGFAILVYCVVAPSVWAFYLWQPTAFHRALLGLRPVLAAKPDQAQSVEEFIRVNQTPSLRRPTVWLPVVVTVIAALVFLRSLSQQNPFLYGRQAFWWQASPICFWSIWMPLIFANVYMMTWIIIRQVQAVSIIKRLFNTFRLEPIPFHPDRCNGLRPIGDFAKASGCLAVLFGFWVAGVVVTPAIFGSPLNLKADTVLLVLLYLPLVALALVPTVWHAHHAMLHHKQEVLAVLAKSLSTNLVQTHPTSIISRRDYLIELERRYGVLKRELAVWPWSPWGIRANLVVSMLPPIATIAAVYLKSTLIP